MNVNGIDIEIEYKPIKHIHVTDSVMEFEYRIQKQAEALERARMLNEQVEQLKEEADKLVKP